MGSVAPTWVICRTHRGILYIIPDLTVHTDKLRETTHPMIQAILFWSPYKEHRIGAQVHMLVQDVTTRMIPYTDLTKAQQVALWELMLKDA